ncbi:hypothetical protein Cni_G23810 [Canna indica]|uniref:Threonylcarbamoyl-AMP synthase n=1 Tax=Canna indica TaxID=4628 RepID=A0AAQ3QKV2_9LILI|nr:hypothetical protein Cni_G23810 [Canna indica]
MISSAKTIERLPLFPLAAFKCLPPRCVQIRSFPLESQKRRLTGAIWSRMSQSLDNYEMRSEGKAVVLPATYDHIDEAIEAIKAEQVIAVPTDTLYGFACDACSAEAVNKIYEIKGRKQTSPLAISVADVSDISRFAVVDHLPHGLLDSLLPGPVTVVLRRGESSILEKSLNPGLDSIGVRVPDFNFIRAISRGCRSALALTSANLSGQPSSVSIKEFENLWQHCAYVYDGGILPSGRAGSTVVDLTKPGLFKVLRPGSVNVSICQVSSRNVIAYYYDVDHYIIYIINYFHLNLTNANSRHRVGSFDEKTNSLTSVPFSQAYATTPTPLIALSPPPPAAHSIANRCLRRLEVSIWEKGRGEMADDWFRRQQAFPMRRRRRRERAYRVGGTLLRASGYNYLKDGRNGLFGIESGTAWSNNFQREESSSYQTSYEKTSIKPSGKPRDKEIPTEEEIRWSSSSVIAKLMGLDEQPPQVVNKQKSKPIGYFQEQSDSLHKLPHIRSAGKNYKRTNPNHICISKIITGKAHRATRENRQFSHTRWTNQSGSQKAHNGGRGWLNFSRNLEIPGCNTNGSRCISREVTGEFRESVSVSKKCLPLLGLTRIPSYDNLCSTPGMNNQCSSEAFHVDDCNSNCGSDLASSTETMIGEARTNFSEKWKVSSNSKKAGNNGKEFSTLPELLFLSDKETQSKALSPAVHFASDEKSSRTRMQVSCGSHLIIRSRDRWEDGLFRKLPKSTSVPASATINGSQNLNSSHGFDTFIDLMKLRSKKLNLRGTLSFTSIKSRNNKNYSNIGAEEDSLSMREIHTTEEKTCKGELVKTTCEGISKLFSVPTPVDMDILMRTYEEPSKLLNNPKASSTNLKEASSDHLQVDYEELDSVRRKDDSEPCNVSLVDIKLREEDCRDDLLIAENHGKDLTLESVNPCDKLLEVLTGSEELGSEECDSLPMSSYLEEEFMDEEERDYTYLLDMLIMSGIHSSKQDTICDACYSPEYPVNPALFGKLEKKYGKLAAWSQSERKLMFDQTNSILAETLAPCMDLHPWANSTTRIGPMWGSEGLIEKTWQMLVRKRVELNCGNAEDKVIDLKWLDLGDNINEIGKEIERLLKEELLEELVAEFLSDKLL